ncbi:arsenate-mycothiol transferase ArsC [Arthrobacter cryoconiti]|nr:hypothetical protein [Arthrobacter cryoconiti]
MSVLILCTANVCRSPMVAFMAARPARLVVDSAGTHVTPGMSICEVSAQMLASGDGGLDYAQHFRSRSVQLLDLSHYSLVLGATRAIRSETVQQNPAVRNKAFTIQEALILLREGLTEAEEVVFRQEGPAPVMIARRGTTATPGELQGRMIKSREHPLDLVDGHIERKKRRHQATLQRAAAMGTELGSALLQWQDSVNGALAQNP